MMKYKVVLVPFPFDDLSSSKVRPAVCLTNPIEPYRHGILTFITSRISASPLATGLVLDSAVIGVPGTCRTTQLSRVATAPLKRILDEAARPDQLPYLE